jgi:hypothetical protein
MKISNYLAICDPFKYALIFKCSRPNAVGAELPPNIRDKSLGTSQPETT